MISFKFGAYQLRQDEKGSDSVGNVNLIKHLRNILIPRPLIPLL